MSKKTKSKSELPTGWWPDFIAPITDAELTDGDHISIAQIDSPSGPESYIQLFTALVPLDQLDEVLGSPGDIGCEIDANGPHPSVGPEDEPGGYQPRFWIHGGDIAPEGFEPLALAWQSTNRHILIVDPGFLMTYALVPRSIQVSPGQNEIHWDDLEEPKHGVVISQPLSVYDFPSASPAWIRVRREYLEDYAFLRGKALVHVFYAHGEGIPGKETARVLASTPSLTMSIPGTRFEFHKKDDSIDLYRVRIWGTRLLLRPTSSPISAGRWDYGDLVWPGYPEPFTRNSLPLMDEVFVSDSVLGEYEGREGFSITPEHGSVSYGSQWAVSYIRRVGRDLLALEVRKLYEGARPSLVRVWHSYAVPKPKESPSTLRQTDNVATRAKKLVFALLEFGELLALFQTSILGQAFNSNDTVGLDRKELRYSGWWKPIQVEPITRHIPSNMVLDRFLDRCEALDKLINESFREADFRKLLCALGCPELDIRELRSLKLLDRILGLCRLSIDTGLSLSTDYRELEKLLVAHPQTAIISRLFSLRELRDIKAHRTDASFNTRLIKALRSYGLDKSLSAPGWGTVTDRIYDGLIDELNNIQAILTSQL